MPSPESHFQTEFPYMDAGHPESLLTSLESLRKSATFCDITLVVDNEEFPAHKVVLSAASPYFAAMFTSEMIESKAEKVPLKELDPRAVCVLLDYIYTGRVQIQPDLVHALLPAASLLQMTSIREACSDFLAANLAPDNCLGIRAFALIHSCQRLENAAHCHSLANFDLVVKSEEFLQINLEQIETFLSSDSLDSSDESKVFQALIKWIRHSPGERSQHFSRLLKTVRLPFVETHFLMNEISNDPLVLGNLEAQSQLISAMRYQIDTESRHRLNSVSSSCSSFSTLYPTVRRRRIPDAEPYIFALGGGSLFSVHDDCEVYNPVTSEWGVACQCLQRRSRTSVTCLGRKLLLVGGFNGTKDLSSVEMFDPSLNSWQEMPSMGSKRSALGVCELNEFVYAIGGSTDGGICLSSAEMFDPLAGRWLSVPSVEIRRRGLCAVSDSIHGSIYAIGGHDGGNHLASVERLDPREGKWRPVAPMSGRRSGSGASLYGGKIYVSGGSDGTSCIASTERYDPVANRWEALAPMSIRRTTHEMVTVKDNLYALGGKDGTNSLAIVEVYDPAKNRWKLGRQMKMRRSSLAACVLDCSHSHNWFRDEIHTFGSISESQLSDSGSSTESKESLDSVPFVSS